MEEKQISAITFFVTMSGVANRWRNMDVRLPYLPRDYHHRVSRKYIFSSLIHSDCYPKLSEENHPSQLKKKPTVDACSHSSYERTR